MVGCPPGAPCRSTSTTKFGCWCVPNCWLNKLMQLLPHDGVAADAVPAVSAPAMPTPPTRVSVVAAASTLLLMDIDDSFLGTPRPCPAHGRVELAPQHATIGHVRPARHAAGSRWPDQDRNG